MSFFAAVLLYSTVLSPSAPLAPIGLVQPTRQWEVLNTADISGNVEYILLNTVCRENNRSSQLGMKNVGTLAFGVPNSKGGNWEFRRAELRDHRKLAPTEFVSLYNTRYRRYLKTGGTNKSAGHFQTSPSYEFQIVDKVGTNFAIYNSKHRSYLVVNASLDNVGYILAARAPG